MQSVLIVEDDQMLSEMYQEKFNMAGYKTFIASNGNEGIEFLKNKLPNIILLDVLMPEKNGFEMLKEMKMKSEYRNIPVLLLTNLGEAKIDMDEELAAALGVKGYMIKTKHTPDDVLKKVKQVLDKK